MLVFSQVRNRCTVSHQQASSFFVDVPILNSSFDSLSMFFRCSFDVLSIRFRCCCLLKAYSKLTRLILVSSLFGLNHPAIRANSYPFTPIQACSYPSTPIHACSCQFVPIHAYSRLFATVPDIAVTSLTQA
jgi:hypothetical protein